MNFTATVGAPYSGPVATFTDSYYSATASDYSIFIAYSNGATSSGTLSGYPGAWTISDNQTFTQAGNVSATVDVGYASDAPEADGTSASVTGSATVAPAPISLSASNVSATVGQDSNQNIATLSDSAGSYASGNYSATLDVNGASLPVTFPAEDSNGDYAVLADLTGLAAGNYSASLNVSESAGGQSVSASAGVSISVTEQPIIVTGSTINATVGVPWSGTIATFDPQNPNSIASDYAATIDYGNGYAEPGAISVANNIFTVTDSQIFNTAGNLSPTITISDAAQSVTGNAAVSVDLSSISLTPAAPALTPYESFSGVLGNLTDSAGSDSIANNLYASVTLNGTTYPLTLASGNSGDYSLIVSTLPTMAPGTYAAQIYAQETSGTLAETTTANFDVTVTDTPITANGVTIQTEAGVPWSGVIANFTHDDLGDPSAFTAATTWGDGSSSTASTVNSGYTVTDTHTFNTPGNFSPATTITDAYGTTATATSTAIVGIAAISLANTPFSLVEGQPFNGAIATLTDTAGQYAIPANYAGTLSVRGVDYPISFTSDGSEDGIFSVSVSLPAFSPVTTWGALNVTETIGAHSVSATGTVPINVADIAPAVSTSALSGPTVPDTRIATFTDADPNATANSFTATINYDDGTQGAATISSSTNYTGQITYFVYAGPDIHASVPDSTPFLNVADEYGLSTAATFAGSDLQAPTSFTAVANGPQEVDLSWTGGTGPIFVSRTLTDGSGLTTFGPIQMGSDGYYADTTVADTAGYVYTIWADDGFGGSNSLTATATTPYAGPTNLQDTIAGSDGVELNWTNNDAGGIVTITRTPAFPAPVEFDNTSIPLADSVSSYIDPNVAEASTYVYTISRTINGVTESSNAEAITVPLDSPTNLQATPTPSGAVTLSWSDPSGVSPDFVVSRTGGSGGPVTFAAQSGDTFQDNTIAELTDYTYTVTATLNGVDSWSPTIDVNTPPATPSLLTTTDVSTHEIDLNWVNNSQSAIDFTVYRSTDGIDFSRLAGLVTDTSYADTTVTPGTRYWYEVGFDSGDETTAPANFSAVSDCVAAPIGVTATGVSPSEIDLTWTNVPPDAQVEVDRWAAGAAESTAQLVATVAAGANGYHDTGVAEDAAYNYRIRTVMSSDGGASLDGAYVYANTAATLIAPPAGLTAVANGTSEIDLSWTNESAVTNTFAIERSTDDATWTALPPVTGGDYHDTGLTDGVLYYYKVQAQVPGGGSSTSVTADATTVLAAPTDLAAVVSGDVVTLAWTNNSLSSATFLVQRYDSDDTGAAPVSFVTDPGATTYSDASATEFHAYAYTVTAQLPGGIASAVSNSASAYVGPAMPTNLTTTAVSTTEIDLTWTNNSQATNSFLVFRSTDGVTFTPLTPYSDTITGVTASPVSGTSYNDTTVTEGTHYWYEVVPVDPAYPIVDDASFSAVADCWSLPAAPTNLAVTEDDANQVSLSWTNNSQGATMFYIERMDPGSDSYAIIDSVDAVAGVNTESDSSVQGNSAYQYLVVAATPDGNVSAVSDTGTTSVTTPVAGVVNLSAAEISATEIDLSWSLSDANATEVDVYRWTDADTTPVQVSGAPLDASTTPFADTGLTPDTHYYYKIRAIDPDGPTGYSVVDAYTLPNAPSGLNATANADGDEVDLTWTNNGDSSTVFDIARMDPGSDEYDVIDTTAPGATSYADTTVSDDNAYSYQVQAPSGDGAAYNVDVDAINATVAIPLSAPTGLTAAANGTGEIDLSWTNNSQNNTGYIVERSDGHNFAIDDADQTWYSDTNVVAGTSYSYTVTATDDSGNVSAPSASASAATAGTLGVGFLEPTYDGSDDLVLENSSASEEGQPVTLNLTDKFAPGSTDPAASGWSIDWGDGHSNNEGPGAGSYSHVYDEPGNYTITASTLDGSFSGTATDLVSVADGSLTLTETDNGSSNTFNGTATFTHPAGHGAQTWYVDWGDGSYSSMGGPAGGDGDDSGSTTDTQAFSHSYQATGLDYTINISVQSDQGLWQTQTSFIATGSFQQRLYGFFGAGGFAGGYGQAGFEDDGAPYAYETGEFSSVFGFYYAENYTISFGDGGENDTASVSCPVSIYQPSGSAEHTYMHAGDYLATLTGSDGVFATTDAKVTNPIPTLTPPAAQIVDAGQAVDISANYSGMPPGITPIAFIDWGDGTGPHLATVDGGESGTITAHLDHSPVANSTGYGVRIYLYNPYQGGGFNYWPTEPGTLPLAVTTTTLYVWGAVLGDGTDQDQVPVDPDATQVQAVTFDYPHPLGEAMDLTLTTSDATDDNLWSTGSPNTDPQVGPVDLPVLGNGTSTYIFTVDPYDMQRTFYVNAISGSPTPTYTLTYAVAGTEDATASTPQFLAELAAGAQGVVGATGPVGPATSNRAWNDGLGVSTVTWQSFANNSPLQVQNTPYGTIQKIFPELQSPNDTAGSLRDDVVATATLNNAQAGTEVYFAVFDAQSEHSNQVNYTGGISYDTLTLNVVPGTQQLTLPANDIAEMSLDSDLFFSSGPPKLVEGQMQATRGSEGVLVTNIDRAADTVTVVFSLPHNGVTTISWSTRSNSTSSPLIPWLNYPATAYQSGAIAYFSAKSDATGTARITFGVTPQPSNDYVVLATTNSFNFLELSQSVADGGPNGPTFYPSNVNGTLSSTLNPRFPTWAKLFPLMAWSDMLQVWRTLHVELDTTAGQAPLTNVQLSLMKNAYANADIVVANDLQPWNKVTSFVGGQKLDPRKKSVIAAARGAEDVTNRDDFWVVHFVTAFVATWYPGQTLMGLAPVGGPVFIFMGGIAEVHASSAPNDASGNPLVNLAIMQQRVIYHETLHLFGLNHSNPQDYHQPGDEGIMYYARLKYAPKSVVLLTLKQLDIIRGSLRPTD